MGPADAEGGPDFGADGRFINGSRTPDPQVWARRHHGSLVVAGCRVLAGALAALLASRR